MTLGKQEAAKIKRRIDVARRYAKDRWLADYDRAMDLYEGEHYADIDQPKDYERLIVNILKPAVETQLAAVGFRYPSFYVQPETPDSQPAVAPSRDALSYAWRKAKAQEQSVHCLRDRLTCGLALQMTWWLFTTTNVEGEEESRTFGARGDVEGEEPDPTPNPVDLETSEPVEEERVGDDRVWTKRLCPKEFWIDPECGRDLEEAIFCGWTEMRPLDEVKRDPKLGNTRKLKGSSKNLKGWLPDEWAKRPEQELPDDLKRVELYHYLEKRRRLHVIMSDESETPHLVERWSWDHERYPFRAMQAPGTADRFFPVPPMIEAQHPQGEVNLCRSVLATHVRQSSPKLQYNGRLTDRQTRQIEKGRSLTVVELDGEAEIRPVPLPPVQPEIFASEQAARSDTQWILGLSPYQTQDAPTKRTTIPEAQAIQTQGNLRGEWLRQEFEEHCSGVAQDMLALLQQNATKTRSLPIYDDRGQVAAFRDYSAEEIRGELTVKVHVSSTTAPSPERALQDLGFLFQTLNATPEAILNGEQVGLHLKSLLRDLLADDPRIKDINRIIPEEGPASMPQAQNAMEAPPGGPMGAAVAGPLPPQPPGLPPGQPDTGGQGGLDLPSLLAMLSNGNTGSGPLP